MPVARVIKPAHASILPFVCLTVNVLCCDFF